MVSNSTVRRLRVRGVVDDLHHADRLDILALAGEDERQQVVRPARIDAGREARDARVGARILERPAHVVGDVGRVDERDDRARHDVLARRGDARHVRDRLGRAQVRGRGVTDAVRVEREQRVGVVRRDDAERIGADDLPRVTPGLVVAVHPQPDELELGVLGDEPRREATDVARAPLDHPVSHDRSS
jgi:hypothetical protein